MPNKVIYSTLFRKKQDENVSAYIEKSLPESFRSMAAGSTGRALPALPTLEILSDLWYNNKVLAVSLFKKGVFQC